MFGFVDQGAADAASELCNTGVLSTSDDSRPALMAIPQYSKWKLDVRNAHAVRGDAKTVADYLDDNPNQLDNRTIFQSTLLHIAARNGRLQVAVELLRRGIDVNALDYVSLLSILCKGLEYCTPACAFAAATFSFASPQACTYACA